MSAMSASQFYLQRAGSLKHVHNGMQEGEPLAAATPLLAFPLLHNTWIEADAGIVQEYAPVHFTDIHASDFAGEQCLHGLLQLKRDGQILGKMIEGPQGQHAKI